jgi:hypothetical protein
MFSIRSYLPPFNQSSKKSINDSAQVLNIMKSTNFCEILSLLYGTLIHETDNNNQIITENNNNTVTVHEKTILIVINSMILLNSVAILDLDTFQVSQDYEHSPLCQSAAPHVLMGSSRDGSTLSVNSFTPGEEQTWINPASGHCL